MQAMNWDQIESKWALMTRRIRTDWCDEPRDVTRRTDLSSKRRDTLAATIADNRTFADKDAKSKTSAK
jgi:hypothetical protein